MGCGVVCCGVVCHVVFALPLTLFCLLHFLVACSSDNGGAMELIWNEMETRNPDGLDLAANPCHSMLWLQMTQNCVCAPNKMLHPNV